MKGNTSNDYTQHRFVVLYPDRPLPGDDDLYELLASQYQVHEPRTVWAWLREAIRLFWFVLRGADRNLTAALARFYFVPHLLIGSKNRVKIHNELAFRAAGQAIRHSFISWPLLSFAVTFVFTLVIVGQAETALWAAAFAGAMGMAGALVCGPLFHISGVGAGGACFGVMFGLTQALLVWRLGGTQKLAELADKSDPFVANVLGVVGSSAPKISPLVFAVSLILPSIAIVASAWLMGQPNSDKTLINLTHPLRLWLGKQLLRVPLRPLSVFGNWLSHGWTPYLSENALTRRCSFLGFFAGFSGVGIVKGLYTLVSRLTVNPQTLHFAFVVIATVVGIICYSICVWVRTQDFKRAVMWGLLYGCMGFVFWIIPMLKAQTLLSLLLNEMGTAFFHACYFTLSYATAFVLGGRRAAFIAATLEGVVGFVVFNLINFVQNR
jgi:hypothetical protein